MATILELHQLLCNHEGKSKSTGPDHWAAKPTGAPQICLSQEKNKLHLLLPLLAGFSIP